MIGWDPVTRSQRLKLVVQLRRFLVVGKTRRPEWHCFKRKFLKIS
jgi:hypothetical protein